MNRPVGRPAPPTGIQIATSVRLYPPEREHLVKKFGSIHAGIRKLVQESLNATKRK